MSQIVVSEFMEESALEPLRHYELLFDPALVDDRSRLLEVVADCAAIIVRNRTQVDAELLDAAPELRVVGRLGVGLDNIDLDVCRRRDIAVHPATGANAEAVAEYVIAVTMMLLRGAYGAGDRLVRGEWPRGELQGRESIFTCMIFVGFGGIARMVAERAAALGMTVAGYDPFLSADDPVWAGAGRFENIASMLNVADVVSLQVASVSQAKHLLDEDSLRQLPAGAVVINTSRGGIVDDRALAAAIRSGHLAGAALDVFETEPLTSAAGHVFADLDNVVLTPHIAGLTQESNRRVSEVTVKNVLNTLGDM